MPRRPGLVLAKLLAGSWRRHTVPAEISAHNLADLAERLPWTGTVALAWERLRVTSLAEHPACQAMRHVHRHNVLSRLRHEHRLPILFSGLRRAGLDPLLIKGWSLLSLYPRVGQRPVGDIDLCLPPHQFAAAQYWLEKHADVAQDVDLHSGVPDLADRSWEAVWRRSRRMPLGKETLRVLCPEDNLRLLCLHFARHGGWRPLWLCDVAAAAESLPIGFDWDAYLAGKDIGTAWTAAVLALAGKLLQARVPPLPVASWLVKSVVGAWQASRPGDSHSRVERSLGSYVTRPAGLLSGLRQRWPNPLEAAFKMSAHPRTRLPLCWFQLRYSLQRSLRWPGRRAAAAGPFALHVDE